MSEVDLQCRRVTIDRHRWEVIITIYGDDDVVLSKYVASSDVAFNSHDGIYFSTYQDWSDKERW